MLSFLQLQQQLKAITGGEENGERSDVVDSWKLNSYHRKVKPCKFGQELYIMQISACDSFYGPYWNHLRVWLRRKVAKDKYGLHVSSANPLQTVLWRSYHIEFKRKQSFLVPGEVYLQVDRNFLFNRLFKSVAMRE